MNRHLGQRCLFLWFNMASQPVTASQYRNVGTVGTTVISNQGVNLNNIIFGGTFVGSVEFYDSATAAGTTASNLVYNVGLPLVNQYKNVEVGLRTRNGLILVATGTPALLFTYDA